MRIEYSKWLRLIIGILCTSIFLSISLEPRYTPNPLKASQENKIHIIYKFGHEVAWPRFGRYNELNTYNGTFTMDMVREINGTLTIQLELSEKELDTIYQKAIEIDFFNYPTTYEVNLRSRGCKPSHYFIFELGISCGFVSRTVRWTSEHLPRDDDKYDNLNDLARAIWNIIKNTPEFNAMPKPNAAYV